MPKAKRARSSPGAASSSTAAAPPAVTPDTAADFIDALTSAQQKALQLDLFRRLYAVDPSSAAEAVNNVRFSAATQGEQNRRLGGKWLLKSVETEETIGEAEFAIREAPPPGKKTGGAIVLRSFYCEDDAGDELWANDCGVWGCSENEEVLEFETEHSVCKNKFKGSLRVYWNDACFHGEFDASDPDPYGYEDSYGVSAAFTLQRA